SLWNAVRGERHALLARVADDAKRGPRLVQVVDDCAQHAARRCNVGASVVEPGELSRGRVPRVPRLRRRACLAREGGCGGAGLVGPSQRARAALRWIVEHDGVVVVPAPILAEATTGDARRDAAVNRVMNLLARASSVLRPPDETVARRAGRLRYRARTDDGID